jgi:hypothetical protein
VSAPAAGEQLTPGDWARCAGLLGLGSLVFLIVYGERSGPFVTLLARYLAIAASGLSAVTSRSGRS